MGHCWNGQLHHNLWQDPTMERKVWCNINLLLHSQDITLKEAIQKTVDNHFF